mmetsp:Transcript_46398/g.120683  ORF Transcript_46398/g.120683 Transcript_46398/m.120683 type:complete len:278 (-) Transcript_46398:511-1344(-)
MHEDPNQRLSVQQALRHPWLAEDVGQPAFDCDVAAPLPELGYLDASLAGASCFVPIEGPNGHGVGEHRPGTPGSRVAEPKMIEKELSASSRLLEPRYSLSKHTQSDDWTTQPPSPEETCSSSSSCDSPPEHIQQSYRLTDDVMKTFKGTEKERAQRLQSSGNGDDAAGCAIASPAPPRGALPVATVAGLGLTAKSPAPFGLNCALALPVATVAGVPRLNLQSPTLLPRQPNAESWQMAFSDRGVHNMKPLRLPTSSVAQHSAQQTLVLHASPARTFR